MTDNAKVILGEWLNGLDKLAKRLETHEYASISRCSLVRLLRIARAAGTVMSPTKVRNLDELNAAYRELRAALGGEMEGRGAGEKRSD